MILAPTPNAAADPEATKAANKLRRENRRAAAGRRRELGPLRKQLKDAEIALGDLSARKATLDRRIADPSTYEGAADVASLLREQAALAVELSAAEARWLAAAQAVEEVDSD